MKRSAKGIAYKACTNPKALSFGDDDVRCLNILANNAENSKLEERFDNWWFEDVSFLQIDQFIELL